MTATTAAATTATVAAATAATATAATATENLGLDRASLPCRRSKRANLKDRCENALVELLNQEAQARAGTNGRYRQRRQPDGCAGKSLNDVGKGGASQPAKGRKAKKAASMKK